MDAVLNAFYGARSATRRIRDTWRSAFLNNNPAQYLLTLGKMVKNDYPVPSYLNKRSEGWLEMPQGNDQLVEPTRAITDHLTRRDWYGLHASGSAVSLLSYRIVRLAGTILKRTRGRGMGGFGLITSRSWRASHSHSPDGGSNGTRTCTAIVDHCNPGAWYSQSATAPATTIACANHAEVLGGLLGALYSHEFIFGRVMGLADGPGWITSKADLAVDAEKRNLTCEKRTEKENAESLSTPPSPNSPIHSRDEPEHAPDSTTCSALTAYGATPLLGEQRHTLDVYALRTLGGVPGEREWLWGSRGEGSGEVHWSLADDRALEEAVVRAWMRLLFVGVKT
ncbi:hypothetical protein EI94DRAFT_1860082 [Lactarius quietus]|nr:hypothetical protein EI94DRAFT_1860082 [Lactarius quietus]